LSPTSVSIEDTCSSTKAKTISEKTKVKDIINFNPNQEDYDVHSDSSRKDSENSVDDDVQNKTPLESYVLITGKTNSQQTSKKKQSNWNLL
jgi:hypothetical protein